LGLMVDWNFVITNWEMKKRGYNISDLPHNYA
jgi:hypothetical protein